MDSLTGISNINKFQKIDLNFIYFVHRIIQDSSLNTSKVYSLTARYLAGNKRISEVDQLVQCIKSNTSNIDRIESFCDEIVCSSIETAYSHFGEAVKPELENLLKKITDIQIKTKCYITTGQLKSAYLLAVQSNNLTDIRKILRQSEILKQPHIKRLCEKKLGGVVPNPPGSTHSSDSN